MTRHCVFLTFQSALNRLSDCRHCEFFINKFVKSLEKYRMNADPRRPDKVQRYVPKTGSGNGQEDLTPDYMNILGQQHQHQSVPVVQPAMPAPAKPSDVSSAEVVTKQPPPPSAPDPSEDRRPSADDLASNVIPTSPQYGVAIIPTEATQPAPESVTSSTDAAHHAGAVTAGDTASNLKPANPVAEADVKELHATPSRNDRFKVVKIASLEPFKRGRWKCMDYVDEAPPAGTVRIPQSAGSIQIQGGAYMQTQSLPQQQIQQMLLQGGFTNGTQFFQPQMMPQGQYYYPQVQTGQGTVPQQVPSTMPAQFIGAQPYFQIQNSMPQNFANLQYVPINQATAFVPTSQIPANFQQSQTYAGQPNVSQAANVVPPLVNGHNFTPQTEQQQGSLPTQAVKSVILTAVGNPQPQPQQQQPPPQQQPQPVQPQIPVQANQSVTVVPSQQFYQQQPVPQNPVQATQVPAVQPVPIQSAVSQTFDQNLANNVYTNPQFAMSVNSLTVLDHGGDALANSNEVTETNSVADAASENADDPAKTNPVVNAIDNKIEQAMDLVKSHLMYTVREEVEVLKEKIAELMERIQQLETENNFLRSQIPKTQVYHVQTSLLIPGIADFANAHQCQF
ncbi:unnamed protein product [Acanthoscelides obtectus]|uniref:Protein Asterix n=3 Tax=Acanthoscelides obtectus TaxID=200917 RepID=A0A9P0LKC9_ACAOB|nr:unnamed protein product [Acanthoscelides obtectus]CAK1642011.1 Protein bunched, class 1/class 3/D/E isoforms [Acanthoscelides obtectus]